MLSYTKKEIIMRQKILTFISVFIVWIILTGRISDEVIVIGVVIAAITTYLFSDMLFRISNRRFTVMEHLRRLILLILFIPVFFYEALVAALKVTKHVFEKEPSFSPGIVKVKTSLTNVSAISILANLITLTPGTLTLDFDKSERVFYIHWIDVTTKEEAKGRKEIIEKFETWLDVIFK